MWKQRPWLTALFATWGAWFFALWPQMFVVNAGGIWSGHPFIWADWSVHLTYISRLTYTPISLWFTHHPVFATQSWSYPPLGAIFSAFLLRLGASLQWSLLFPVVLATAALLVLLFAWFSQQKLSDRASYLGLSLFLSSGAWGSWHWVKTILQSTNAAAEIAYPSRLYTQIFESHLVWLNPITGMILPQRAFLFGFPILLGILLLVHKQLFTREQEGDQEVRSGVIVGMLSALLFLTHVHSFFSLAILCTVWFALFLRRWKFWLSFGLSTALLSFPYYWFVLRRSSGVSAFSLDLGWMAPEPFQPVLWIIFWLSNWGWFIPLALLGFWQSNAKERFWLTAFWSLFLFANIIRTQSYDWDNSKIFIVVLIGILPAALRGLQFLRRFLQTYIPRILAEACIVLVVLLSLLPGAIEILRISQVNQTFWNMAGPEEIEFAQKVRENVPVDKVILTSDLHNHPVPMLSGRPVLMGYIGWVWSYGFNYQQIEKDVALMFTDPAQSRNLRAQYGIEYVVIGPHERSKFSTEAIEMQCLEIERTTRYRLFRCF